jgi:hypothetical protein
LKTTINTEDNKRIINFDLFFNLNKKRIKKKIFNIKKIWQQFSPHLLLTLLGRQGSLEMSGKG